MKARFVRTDFEGVFVVEVGAFPDDRGYFMESYNVRDFKENGILSNFVQDNFSFSKKGVIRGLHFQKPPHEVSKLVQCIEGEIYDVIVDLRKNSPTFCKWQVFYLSEENKKQLYVPKGFAHGFCVVSESAKALYKVDEFYYPECDGALRWDDPDLAIAWPIDNPIVSEKDKKAPLLKELI